MAVGLKGGGTIRVWDVLIPKQVFCVLWMVLWLVVCFEDRSKTNNTNRSIFMCLMLGKCVR